MDDPHRILIIKTGALGDVVRSTILLRVFAKQQITWITDLQSLPLFDQLTLPGLAVWPIQQLPANIEQEEFDLVLSLEEDEHCARLASRLHTNRLTGVFWNGALAYTADAAAWFDLSLISRFGKTEANRLKQTNTASYQELIFSMLGQAFKGEPYWIRPAASPVVPGRIGIESQAGMRWPNKQWLFYPALKTLLEQQGFDVLWLQKKNTLQQYLDDIHSCSLLVSGDTLAMHLALAYQIPAVALFTCTSPAEIYDYGMLHKLVSPRLTQYFYSTAADPRACTAIALDLVFHAVLDHWSKFYPVISQKPH